MKDNPAVEGAARAALEEARVSCERLRILLDDKEAQQAARLALRHAYAVLKRAQTGKDPRADQFSDEPNVRLRKQLTLLYSGVRSELGMAHPDAVYEDPDD